MDVVVGNGMKLIEQVEAELHRGKPRIVMSLFTSAYKSHPNITYGLQIRRLYCAFIFRIPMQV